MSDVLYVTIIKLSKKKKERKKEKNGNSTPVEKHEDFSKIFLVVCGFNIPGNILCIFCGTL